MNNGLTETEKKEKRALEKKLSEMEEELKVRLMNISQSHLSITSLYFWRQFFTTYIELLQRKLLLQKIEIAGSCPRLHYEKSFQKERCLANLHMKYGVTTYYRPR